MRCSAPMSGSGSGQVTGSPLRSRLRLAQRNVVGPAFRCSSGEVLSCSRASLTRVRRLAMPPPAALRRRLSDSTCRKLGACQRRAAGPRARRVVTNRITLRPPSWHRVHRAAPVVASHAGGFGPESPTRRNRALRPRARDAGFLMASLVCRWGTCARPRAPRGLAPIVAYHSRRAGVAATLLAARPRWTFIVERWERPCRARRPARR